jgi:hypothetical protein
MFYIYAYIDPRTDLPFYIGKGKDTRKFDHLNEASSKKENKEKFKIIKELKSLNLSPVIIELETNIENELMAYNREDYYILTYGRKGIEPNGILTNKTIGGKHPPKPVWTEEKRKQHSKFNKLYWTEERKKNHPIGHSVQTVSVTDLNGNSRRISKIEYDAVNKNSDMSLWKYVPVASKESKRRKESKNTLP